MSLPLALTPILVMLNIFLASIPFLHLYLGPWDDEVPIVVLLPRPNGSLPCPPISLIYYFYTEYKY